MTMCAVEAESFHVDGWTDRRTNKAKLIRLFAILRTCLNGDKNLLVMRKWKWCSVKV